mmetsp:Transcript_38106/g.82847  ORF Transcript_38106/g.82847 Transcript_38106/m.82847 type:complete len:314 (-) Transcript_38106:169-1110(-)
MDQRQVQQTAQQTANGHLVAIAKKVFTPTPKKVAFSSFYLLGIFLCCFFVPPEVPPEKLEVYTELMSKADSVPGFREAEEALFEARYALEDVEVWFWKWRGEPYTTLVPERRMAVQEAEAHVAHLERKRHDLVVKAKKTVGLFSSFAVGEVKQLFWGYVEKGKIFAKRQTFWNGLFMVLESREGNLFSFLLEWALALLVNFTLGLVGALVAFVLFVYSIITSYQPDSFSGMLFFLGAVLAGASMVLTYLVGIYGVTGGAIYVAASAASSAARARLEQDGGQPRRPTYIRQGAHFDAYGRPRGYPQGYQRNTYE